MTSKTGRVPHNKKYNTAEEKRAAKNLQRRERYRSDPQYAQRIKQASKAWWKVQYYGENSAEFKAKLNARALEQHHKKYNIDMEHTFKIRQKVIERNKNMDIQKYLFLRTKKSAKDRHIHFDLDLEDFYVPENCPHCGVKLLRYVGLGKRGPDAYSVDRIDSSKGYIKGNTVVVCWRSNDLKKDATIEELQQLLDWMTYLKNEFSA